MTTHDIIVVGGGIIGAGIAWELAERGKRVLLVDRQQPGQEASWAAAGMLAPGPEYAGAEALVELGSASFALYPEFVRRVEARSAMRTGFREKPAIHLYFGEPAEAEQAATLARFRKARVPLEAIGVGEARRLEPLATPQARCAVLAPREAHVDNRALTTAVLTAAARAGAEVGAGTPVQRLLLSGAKCIGVETPDGKIFSGCVVLAAGPYCSQIEGMAQLAPTRPVRGQMVALRAAGVQLGHVLRSERGYLVPRDDGRIVCGSTLEDAGYEKRLTPAGLRGILDAALELAPQLAGAEVVESWSGLRPDTPDHLPIIGPADMEGLFLATGHFRNGILLAPITVKNVAEWIVEGKPSLDLRAYSPLRFAASLSTASAGAAAGDSAAPKASRRGQDR